MVTMLPSFQDCGTWPSSHDLMIHRCSVSQFACVQHYGFHSSFLIVCFPYTEDDPRSQHLVVRPTVCSTHCSCATNVHLIPASGDDEVNHMPMSRAGMRSGGLVCILPFEQ